MVLRNRVSAQIRYALVDTFTIRALALLHRRPRTKTIKPIHLSRADREPEQRGVQHIAQAVAQQRTELDAAYR